MKHLRSTKNAEKNLSNEELEFDQTVSTIKSVIKEEVLALLDEINGLRQEIKILKESNIDMVKLLSNKPCTCSNTNNNKNKELEKMSDSSISIENLNTSISDNSDSSLETIIPQVTPQDIHAEKKLSSGSEKTINKKNKNVNKNKSHMYERDNKHTGVKKKIIGENNEPVSIGFTAANPVFWLYVGKCKSDTTEEDVKKYLQDKIPNRNVSVKKLKSLGSNAAFCVGIEGEREEEFYNPQLWPRGILVRRYKLFRSSGGDFKQP